MSEHNRLCNDGNMQIAMRAQSFCQLQGDSNGIGASLLIDRTTNPEVVVSTSSQLIVSVACLYTD